MGEIGTFQELPIQQKKQIKKFEVDRKIASLNFGQFLFVYFLGRNVEYNTYEEILKALPKKENNPEPSEGVYPNIATAPQHDEFELKQRHKSKAEEAGEIY